MGRAGTLSVGSTSEEGQFQQDVYWGRTPQGSFKSYLPSCSCGPATPIASGGGRELRGGCCLPQPRPKIFKSVSIIWSPGRWHSAQTACWPAHGPCWGCLGQTTGLPYPLTLRQSSVSMLAKR